MKRTALALTGLALAVGSASVYAARRGAESTSKESASTSSAAGRPLAIAATESRTAPVSPRANRVTAEGRVVTYPGAEIVLGTDFAGRISRFLVTESARVQKGDLLVELDSSEQRAALAAATARIGEAEADLKLAEFEVGRATKLLDSRVGTPQALDKAQRDREAAQARRLTAKAEVERLTVQIGKSRIVAPFSGVVLTRHAEPGETVPWGARLLTLADVDRLRIEAEVDEYDSNRITLGANVVIRAEGDPGPGLTGTVEEIPASVTNRRLKAQDPGRPSDTRVLLVKIALPGKTNLKLGRRVEVEIGG